MKNTYKMYFLPVLMVMLLLCTMVTAHAQTNTLETATVTISPQQKSLDELLKTITAQTGYKFNYDVSQVNIKQSANLTFKGSLNEILPVLASRFGLDFGVSGTNISVRKAATKKVPQVKILTGVVTGKSDGQPIPGVNIFKKGTRQGAITNANGEFTLRIVGEDLEKTTLEFIYIGMKTKEVSVGNQTYFKVEMDNDIFGMNEVVVTGSYTKDKRREDVVGSIAQVSAAKLQAYRPIESFDKMLEGLVAGVQVETTTELNTPVKINIRGQGSLPSFGASRGTSTQPLFVIDGIPAYEQQKGNEASVFGGESYLNPLSNINPEDIKSVSILKDATASALYGANAANGVIIITTKGGATGKTRLNFNYDTGVSSFINEYNWLTGPEYYSLLRETYINGGRSVTEASVLAGSKTIDTDWFGLTNRNAIYHNAGMDVSGGSDKTTFRFGSGYRNQQSSSLGNDLEKVYLRLRVDHQLVDKFKVGFNFSPTLTKSNALSTYGGVLLPPNISPINADGVYGDILGVPNPLAILTQNQNSNKGIQLLANANATYQITKEIALSGTIGADSYQNKQTQYASSQNATGRNARGRLEIYDRNYIGYIGFVQATFDKTFKERHTVNFLVGTQVEDKNTELLRGSATGFTYDRLRVLNAGSNQTSASSTNENATISYYSQLGYDLNKKYYANFNGRLDKSSIFGGDKQVAFNGSVGLAWVVSNEDFLKGNKAINLLKLRSTYGSTGNSRIGSYSARGLYDFGTSSGNSYNGNVASYPDNVGAPNPDLGWEKNFKLNFGLDLTLFNTLQLTAEYFSNTIEDLISSVNVPLETGYATISANTGKMRNQGFELSINTDVLQRKNFNWNLAFNLGTNKNKILSFNNGYSALYSSSTDAAALKVGGSSSAVYGYRWAGVNPQTGSEQFYDNMGQVRTANEIQALPISSTSILGDRLPDFQGGFINNFNLYDFNLSFNILYSYGADKLVSPSDESDGRNLQNRNQSANLLDRWQRPGDITTIPKLMIIRDVVANSSRYLYDMSYLKLANISLGYKLPSSVASKLHLNSTSIFANATNLLYMYKDAGTKGRNGIAERRFIYPETSAFTFGIRVGL